jgi:exopolysaccharide biosynthesis protein
MEREMKLFTRIKEKVKKEEKQKENELEKAKETKGKKPKVKRTWKQRILLCLKVLVSFIILGILFIVLFFKTNLFQSYKELWVQTAMTTMSHQYLATWFLSEEEIQEIMDRLEVKNDENSDNSGVVVRKNKGEVTVEKITGTGYVGYVMIVPDASKVKLIDTRIEDRGLKLTEIVEKYNAIGAINAGGYVDPQGKGMGNILLDAVIMNRELLNGDKDTSSSLIGLDKKGKLILGRYTYQEALDVGMESAIKFGPYLIVNGKNQIQNANSGGLHPRTAIGQRQDGTMILVVIDGRQPGYSIGANLLELQTIFERYGAYNAANLDGGYSSAMCFDGELVTTPSTLLGERYLPNAFIVEK